MSGSTTPPRRGRFTRGLQLLGLPLILAVVGACGTIPTSGPVQSVGRAGPIADSEVEINPADPLPGAEPSEVVAGFLQATASQLHGDTVAREYLATGVRQDWNPDAGITVYGDEWTISEGSGGDGSAGSVLLKAPVTGHVNADGSYTPGVLLDPDDPTGSAGEITVAGSGEPELSFDFELIRDVDGEWRISNPPPGRLVQEYLFNRFYTTAAVYYYDPDFRTLVPDPVVVPQGRQNAGARLRALFDGPTQWLAPSVRTAIPEGTQLSVGSVFLDAEGIADVSLVGGPELTAMGDETRSRLRDQIVATLSDSEISAVRLSVAGDPFRVPGADERGVVQVQIPADLDPIPVELGEQLFGSTGELVATIDDDRGFDLDGTGLVPLAGPWGTEAEDVEAMSPSLTGDRVAAVTDGGTRIQQGSTGIGEPLDMVSGTDLLRPQYVDDGRDELWAIDAADNTVSRVVGRDVRSVSAPGLAGVEVVNFRISPDGGRMAIVGERDGQSVLGLVRIDRLGEVAIDGWRTLPIDGEPFDVAWMSDLTLMVLAEGQGGTGVWRVSTDGTPATELTTPDGWDAESIAALPRHRNSRVVVTGQAGTWRYVDDATWREVGPGLQAIGFAA